jgi:hypothetical protein
MKRSPLSLQRERFWAASLESIEVMIVYIGMLGIIMCALRHSPSTRSFWDALDSAGITDRGSTIVVAIASDLLTSPLALSVVFAVIPTADAFNLQTYQPTFDFLTHHSKLRPYETCR